MGDTSVERKLRALVRAELKTKSLRDLEAETGVSFNTLSRYSRRIRSRTFNSIKRLAEALGHEIRMEPKARQKAPEET